MKAFFLTLLLTASCTKYAPVIKDQIGVRIENVELNIKELHDITWKVGKFREYKVSQGLFAVIELPHLSDEDLDYLSKQKNVDSWILRVIVQRGSEAQDLGSLYAPFRSANFSGDAPSGGSPTQVALKIHYAASFASERFRKFNCPAFGHTKRLNKFQLAGEKKPISITFDQHIPYEEKSQKVELNPSGFNAGHSLVGNYFFEIAPYNKKEKTILSSFIRLPVYLEVMSEETQDLPSCSGLHPEFEKAN
jgi:hypothetical protein